MPPKIYCRKKINIYVDAIDGKTRKKRKIIKKSNTYITLESIWKIKIRKGRKSHENLSDTEKKNSDREETYENGAEGEGGWRGKNYDI